MIGLKHTDYAVSAEATNQNRSDRIILEIISLHNAQTIGGVHLTPSEAYDLGRELMRAAAIVNKQKRR